MVLEMTNDDLLRSASLNHSAILIPLSLSSNKMFMIKSFLKQGYKEERSQFGLALNEEKQWVARRFRA